MRIVEDTPRRLTLEDRPWLIGSILAFVILFMTFLALVLGGENLWMGVGMGLGAALFGVAFVAFVRRVIVIFDRSAGAVVIRTASLLGMTEQTIALSQIVEANVETTINRSSSNGSKLASNSETHRTVLRTRGEPVPLTQVSSAGDAAARNAEAINRWLADPRATP